MSKLISLFTNPLIITRCILVCLCTVLGGEWVSTTHLIVHAMYVYGTPYTTVLITTGEVAIMVWSLPAACIAWYAFCTSMYDQYLKDRWSI